MMRGLGLSGMMLIVTSCTSISEGRIQTDTGCLTFKPIYFSDKDTKETIRQIIEHDAVYTELCND